jgi:hypothetical protein
MKTPRRSLRQQQRRKSSRRAKSYFKRGNKLSEEHRKYCRCVYHVAGKQTDECLRKRSWGGKCYNPYSVCTASTKRRGLVNCFENTNLRRLPRRELEALAALKRMSVSELRQKRV